MKEFWIVEKEHDPDQCVHEGFPGAIRVIERAEYDRLHDEYKKLNSALTQIYFLGKGELAYTKDFTEEVLNIAHRAITGKERGL